MKIIFYYYVLRSALASAAFATAFVIGYCMPTQKPGTLSDRR